MKHALAGLGFALSALSLTACGGIAIYTEGGSGGAGGGGEGGSSSEVGTSSVGTSSVSTSDASSTSSGPVSACDTFCATLGMCVGSGDECFSQCSSIFGLGCDEPASALVDCYLERIDPMTCAYDGGCEAQENAFDACANPEPFPPSCTTNECAASETACSCSGFCDGVGDLEVSCSTNSTGEVVCDCATQDIALSCSQPELVCELTSSCCYRELFGPLPD